MIQHANETPSQTSEASKESGGVETKESRGRERGAPAELGLTAPSLTVKNYVLDTNVLILL